VTLPSKVVYDLLMNDANVTSLVNPDMVFVLDVPENYQKIQNAPIIRINEIGDYQENYASNKPFSFVFSIQIDVWAKDLETLDIAKETLDKLLSDNNWSQYNGFLDKDPDINLFRLARRYRTTQTVDFS
jgi:hypothetical protein